MARKNDKKDVQEQHAGDLGALLKQYRESAGFTVAQTADALCLSEVTINKLENEEFDTLAEPPYIRGYLRGYAKIADKSPDDLVKTYETLRGAEPNELEHRFKPANSSITKRRPAYFSVLAKLALLGLVIAGLSFVTMIPGVQTWFSETWSSFSQQANDKTNKNLNNPDLIGNMPAPLPMSPEEIKNTNKINNKNGLQLANTTITSDTNKVDQKNTAKTADTTTPTVSDEAIKSIDKDLDKNAANSKTDTDSSSSSSSSAKIKLVFSKEVWLRIKDKNKKTVYEGQTSAGKEKELELEKPLTFRIGNAQGVTIFVDGQEKDISSYIKGSVANFTIE